jgi:hypothetical protein
MTVYSAKYAHQTHIKRPSIARHFSWFQTPFHGKIAIIFENLNRFGTTFQKVFCHSAKSQTPLAEYFSSCKAIKYNNLRRQKKVFCHSAKAQREPKKA